jgi:hypothetical protein
MSLSRRLARLEKQAANRPEAEEMPADEWAGRSLDRPADEVGELARATAAAFANLVGQYREFYKLSAKDAVERADEPCDVLLQRALTAPPDQIDWHDLDTIARTDPEAAQRRWVEIKEAARGEVRTGHRAAEAVTCYFATSWSRARFLAVRAELIDSLGPRNAAELLLIDQMATYQTRLWEWEERLTSYAAVAAVGSRVTRQRQGVADPPRMTDAEAMEQAAAMVERFQRQFLRALAAFHAQRRRTPVVVRRAGQVNLAHNQQVNMTG